MLLRFSASNHASLRTAQELSLIASALKGGETDLIPMHGSTEAVLPAAVIYGANASGKSAVVGALAFLRSAVLFSHTRGQPFSKIPREPFALDPEQRNRPSKFDIDFLVDGVRYHYGFEASDTAFEAEWLYAFPRNRRQKLYERSGQDYEFGRQLKGMNHVIKGLTRPNSLFLSAALQNDHPVLTKIGSFFRNIGYVGVISVSSELLSARLETDHLDERILRFLTEIGTGVYGYRRTEESQTEEARKFIQDFASFLKTHAPRKLNLSVLDSPSYKIELGHRGAHGDIVYLDAAKESSGTRRLLVLLGAAFAALDSGSLLVVDELDASLHTKACEAVLSLFCSRQTNVKGAQLIATTHDTNLLRSKFLRRDQIWFTEKDSEGATHLYPLSDFHARQDDNLEKGYLQGRFGAIPFSGSPLDLLGIY